MFETLSASKSDILDAAALCFMELGTDTASIDDIAHSLGSTKGRIYHHFPSKGALLAAVKLRAAYFTHQSVASVIDTDLSPSACLHRMARAHVLEVLHSLPYHKVILQTSTRLRTRTPTTHETELQAQVQEGQRHYTDLFRIQIQRGMDAGEFAPRAMPVVLSGVLLQLNSPVFWYQSNRTPSRSFDERVANDLADMALASLRP